MSHYQHILLATDYSQQSKWVSLKAKNLAAQFNATLSIVHVIDDIPLPDVGYGEIIQLDKEINFDDIADVKNNLLLLAKQLQVEKNNCWLIWGNPKQEIERFAEKLNADLIIVGSHTRHGLATFLGSTANSILHHAQCDVLAVRLPES